MKRRAGRLYGGRGPEYVARWRPCLSSCWRLRWPARSCAPGWPEAVVAVPAAVVVLGTGAISLDHARAEAGLLGRAIGFLAAVLVLAQPRDDEGLFRACGAWTTWHGSGAAAAAAACGLRSRLGGHGGAEPGRRGGAADPGGVRHGCPAGGTPQTACVRLYPSVEHRVLAAACLQPDEPAGVRCRWPPPPPDSARPTVLPWLVAIGVEYAVFRRFFATDLDAGAAAPPGAELSEVPVFVLAVLACTLAGFVLASAVGANPAWAALCGAAVLWAAPWPSAAPPPLASSEPRRSPFYRSCLA